MGAAPLPTSVSERARSWLAMSMERAPMPAFDDTEGWLRHIERTDAMMAERFLGTTDLPVEVETTEAGGVPTFVITPQEPIDADAPTYLSIHGGGLILGGGDLCRAMGSVAAMGAGLVTWSPDYRMPPLHPYPASLDDCLAVYRALLDRRPAGKIVISGASAGGNLAAAMVLRAKDEGLPMPAGLVLLTPEVDLTESGDSFTTNLECDNILGPLMDANLLYADGHDLAHPYLSPLFGDLAGLPPTFLQTGTRDLYLSNTVRMHRALRSAGVDAELHVWEAMPHGGFGGAPEDMEVVLELRRFLDRIRS